VVRLGVVGDAGDVVAVGVGVGEGVGGVAVDADLEIDTGLLRASWYAMRAALG
jgi:hypothetical protein